MYRLAGSDADAASACLCHVRPEGLSWGCFGQILKKPTTKVRVDQNDLLDDVLAYYKAAGETGQFRSC